MQGMTGVELVVIVSVVACALYALVILLDAAWARAQRAAERYDTAAAEYALATARWLDNRGACQRDARGRFIRHACHD